MECECRHNSQFAVKEHTDTITNGTHDTYSAERLAQARLWVEGNITGTLRVANQLGLCLALGVPQLQIHAVNQPISQLVPQPDAASEHTPADVQRLCHSMMWWPPCCHPGKSDSC